MIPKKILFVLNPISGGKNKQNFIKKTSQTLGYEYTCEWLYWQSPQQDIIFDIKNEISNKNIDIVVAAGGDGTINAVANALVFTDIPMAIIPFGSGNGFARHLKIPLQWQKALEVIKRENIIRIDTASLNQHFFICTAGVGFDAHIGHLFSKMPKRGPISYVKCVVNEFNSYKSNEYEIKTDNNTLSVSAFLITVANAGQYGNNAWIAPEASLQDGLLDVVIMSDISWTTAPKLAYQLFLKKINNNKKITLIKTTSLTITSKSPNPVHYDGEPAIINNPLVFKIEPQSLSVIC